MEVVLLVDSAVKTIEQVFAGNMTASFQLIHLPRGNQHSLAPCLGFSSLFKFELRVGRGYEGGNKGGGTHGGTSRGNRSGRNCCRWQGL